MKDILNSHFFSSLFGFSAILALGLAIVMLTNYYQISVQDIKEVAIAIIFGR